MVKITHLRVSDSTVLGTLACEHDNKSNGKKLTFGGDAVPTGSDVAYVTYVYSAESVDRLESENYWDDEDGFVFSINYHYDLAGNRTIRIRQPAESERFNNTVYYQYNELNQLMQAKEREQEAGPVACLIGAT